MRKIICAGLIAVLVLSLCACGSVEKPKTNEELAIEAVEEYGRYKYGFKTIGGNELKSSKFTVTTIQFESETVYTVYGKAVMVDVYDKKWDNEFSCKVKYDAEENEWEVKDFAYKYKNWT